ncbi:hypothetical protein MAPG_06284 [Magnaporthiopsis poae ATCC 64411]|uniref:Uncharacterized protein n=1 Tax=Magnaporthiopsis poae (strain ATCC 64411 / 73-15) TaxID=644358 RepID=A0A0C4E1L9_MAGP6|nr:hypothetical protein MAPG_06284 [Magnaporthiopsis poae ATCC 64411]
MPKHCCASSTTTLFSVLPTPHLDTRCRQQPQLRMAEWADANGSPCLVRVAWKSTPRGVPNTREHLGVEGTGKSHPILPCIYLGAALGKAKHTLEGSSMLNSGKLKSGRVRRKLIPVWEVKSGRSKVRDSGRMRMRGSLPSKRLGPKYLGVCLGSEETTKLYSQ